MIVLFLLGCSSLNDTGDGVEGSTNSPYIATGSATIPQSQEASWLVEYSNGADVQFLFSAQEAGELQFSIFSSEGELLWAIDTQSPSNESYWIDPDCAGLCSFVAKSYVHFSTDPIEVELRVLASSYDDVVMTSLP